MRFKDFIEQDDAATKTHISMMADGEKEADPYAATTTFHDTPATVLNNKVAQIVTAVQQLDPFIKNRGRTSISGTPDFMAPELSSGVTPDPDWLTYLYASTATKHPGLAAMLKPVVALGQRFLSNVVNLMNDRTENVELTARLDLRNFEGVRKAMETIRQTLSKISPQELKGSSTLAAVVSSFTPFYTKFRVIADRVSQYLGQQYQQVQHLKWDQT